MSRINRKVVYLRPPQQWPKNADIASAQTRGSNRREMTIAKIRKQRKAQAADQLMRCVGEAIFG